MSVFEGQEKVDVSKDAIAGTILSVELNCTFKVDDKIV
jgi:hypothetical protein